MKKNGFTLIELLASIVVMGIILAITIPVIVGVIDKATKNAFEEDTRGVLTAIDYYSLQHRSFDITTIDKNTVASILNLSNANYESVTVTKEGTKANIVIVGKDKWDGLVAHGTIKNITVETTDLYGLDETPPVITLTGNSLVTLALGQAYSDAGATATDNVDGDITAKIVVTSNVNNEVAGIYSVVYTVSDAAGNYATPVVRIVEVEDTSGPIITLLGDNPVSISVGDTYSDAGATAYDETDGDLTDSIEVVSNVDPNAIGSYTVIYNVSDSSGNNATPVVRVVNVEDGTPPVIALLGDNPMVIELGSVYSDPGATATDNVDGDISAFIQTLSTVNPNIEGSYNVTYNVSDSAGNNAIQVTRTVIVMQLVYNYSYTGDFQTLTVPTTGTYRLECWGAEGGGSKGGKGAYATGLMDISSGTVLNIVVGEYLNVTGSQAGSRVTFGGGGAGGGNNGYPGGGASDIRINGASLSNRVIVAAGGGGTSGGNGSAYGGYGGAATGGTGQSGDQPGGTGGTQSAGGIAGRDGTNGTLGQGGNGGDGGYWTADYSYPWPGGGAGGGYYGGGGGGGDDCCGYGGGGGGGSSYIGGVTSSQMLAGNQTLTEPNGSSATGHTGAGYVRITYLP